MLELSPSGIKAALFRYAEKELDWPSFESYVNYDAREYDVPGIGSVKIVDYKYTDSHKNYDDWTEDIWIVFEIQGKLYRANGTYTSYLGSEWEDDLKEVHPQERIIVEYVE